MTSFDHKNADSSGDEDREAFNKLHQAENANKDPQKARERLSARWGETLEFAETIPDRETRDHDDASKTHSFEYEPGRKRLRIKFLSSKHADDPNTLRQARRDSIEIEKLHIEIEKLRAEVARKRQSNLLRVILAIFALLFVGAQLIASDWLVFQYMNAQLAVGRTLPTEFLIAWLAASLVEVIGILWVIARSLFPFRDKHRDQKAENKKQSSVIRNLSEALAKDS